VIDVTRPANTVFPTDGLILNAGEVNLVSSMEPCLLGADVRGRGGRNAARWGRRAADWLLKSGTEAENPSAALFPWPTARMEFGLPRRRFFSRGSVSELSGLEGLRLILRFEMRVSAVRLPSGERVG
jgi:hypothetical protein